MKTDFYGYSKIQEKYKDPTDIYRDFNDKFRNKYLKEFYEEAKGNKFAILCKLNVQLVILHDDVSLMLGRSKFLLEFEEKDIYEQRTMAYRYLSFICSTINELRKEMNNDIKDLSNKHYYDKSIEEIKDKFCEFYSNIKNARSTFIANRPDNKDTIHINWLDKMLKGAELAVDNFNKELIDLEYEPIELYGDL